MNQMPQEHNLHFVQIVYTLQRLPAVSGTMLFVYHFFVLLSKRAKTSEILTVLLGMHIK